MEKRYQVFVSSTFSDLQEERQEIIQALLEINSFLPGWNSFPLLTKINGHSSKKSLMTATVDDEKVQTMEILADCFQTIKVQLRAVGLISKSPRTRSVKDTGTYWSLTAYGDAVMTRLRAIIREVEES